MNILVFLEQRDAVIKKAAFEALSAASALSAEAGGHAIGVIIGPAPSNLDQAGRYGAAKVLHVDDARLAQYATSAYARAVADAATTAGCDVVFLSATAMGRDLAPRLAVKLDGGLLADITAVGIEDGAIVATRPVFAGKALERARIRTAHQVFSLRPNVFTATPGDAGACPVEACATTVTDADLTAKVTGTSVSSGKIDVAEADIIVSGGRGMQGPEHWGLIEDLAGVLGAATGASRAVVDAGWRPHAEQVGQTGKTVAPTLYVACAISGAVQHLAGMSSSKVIVAINKDKDAPIFQAADYGLVGDVFEVLPALTAEIKRFTGN